MINPKLDLGVIPIADNIGDQLAPHSSRGPDLASAAEPLDRLRDGGDDIAVANDDDVEGGLIEGLHAVGAGLVLRDLVLGVLHDSPVAVLVDVGVELEAIGDERGPAGALVRVCVAVDVAVDFVFSFTQGHGGCRVEGYVFDRVVFVDGAGMDEAAEENNNGAGQSSAKSHFLLGSGFR